MCVRDNKWREDDQPGWPGYEPGARAFSADDSTQVLPEARGADAFASAAGETAVLPEIDPRNAGFRDPWGEAPAVPEQRATAEDEPTVDPHEVTIQLDAVSLRADGSIAGQAPAQEGSEGPVFVDTSGRRSRLYRRIGIVVGLACAVYAVVIVATLMSGNADAPWLPVPGEDTQKAGQVDTSPLPGETVDPSATAETSPDASPSGGETAAPSTRATAPGAGAASTADPGGSTATTKPSTAQPSTGAGTSTGTGSSTGGTRGTPNPAAPTTSAAPSSPPVNPPDPGGSDTNPDPGGDPGTDSVANGAPEPQPVTSTTPPPESTI